MKEQSINRLVLVMLGHAITEKLRAIDPQNPGEEAGKCGTRSDIAYEEGRRAGLQQALESLELVLQEDHIAHWGRPPLWDPARK